MIATLSSPLLQIPARGSKDIGGPQIAGWIRVEIAETVTVSVCELSRRHSVSAFTTLLCSWAALLARWSGCVELSVGRSAGTVAVKGDMLVSEFLRLVERTLSEGDSVADSYQFKLELVSNGGIKNGQRAEISEERSLDGRCALSLSLQEEVNGLTGWLQFARDRFEEDMIEGLVSNWEVMLESISSCDDKKVGKLQWMTSAQRSWILEGFNEAKISFPKGRLIHVSFEEQARTYGDSIAVSFKDRVLTYGSLNRRANQLAWYLREGGVGPDRPVAICFNRGLEMMIGLLAILKAGGAYVPMDPSYPRERLRYVLRDCNPLVLLTDRELGNKLKCCGIATIAIDAHWDDIGLRSEYDVPASVVGVRPENLAYIIYTSGSTGIPKGVMVEHRNVTRFLAMIDRQCDIEAGSRWASCHSYAFDFSVLEIWGALLSGACLVVVSYATSRFPKDLYALLLTENVAVLSQTPSAFRQLMTVPSRSRALLALRAVILGGEALRVKTLEPWFERDESRVADVINMYGPTETTVFVTCAAVKRHHVDPHGGSVIGTPFPHSRIYILDECREPVALGVVGEIHIGGTGVARGYLRRPELTAERFLADPFAPGEGSRMYCSGDLGRWRADGTLEYLGRNDSQVKVRGFRIELGDVESHLTACRGVKDAVVVVSPDQQAEARLVAYLTLEDGTHISGSEVRALLAQRLPIHMVPGEYVILPSLPLSANGKVDRNALAASAAALSVVA